MACVRVVEEDRWPEEHPHLCSVVDVQGLLVPELAREGHRILLVRPDRYVAGAFLPKDERAMGDALVAALHRGSPTSPPPVLAESVPA